MRKLQYISDIHLERRQRFPRIKPKCGKLALLGDIGHPKLVLYRDFLKYTSHNWEKVYLLSGNHEFYYLNGINVDQRIRDIASKYSNITYLNNQKIYDNEFKCNLMGTTLWSNLRRTQYPLDFQTYQLHCQSIKWLTQNLNNHQEDTIVLSHYLPTYRLIVEPYIRCQNLDRYASHLDHLIKSPVKVWLCGHSHIEHRMEINGVQVGINAMGHKDKWNDEIVEF